MRPVPIPDDFEPDARRVVIGEPGDVTRTDVRPAEYVVRGSRLYLGRPTFTALVALEPGDLERLAAGARLALTLDGAEVPWSIELVGGEDPADAWSWCEDPACPMRDEGRHVH